jgi:hypothetical protein
VVLHERATYLHVPFTIIQPDFCQSGSDFPHILSGLLLPGGLERGPDLTNQEAAQT